MSDLYKQREADMTGVANLVAGKARPMGLNETLQDYLATAIYDALDKYAHELTLTEDALDFMRDDLVKAGWRPPEPPETNND